RASSRAGRSHGPSAVIALLLLLRSLIRRYWGSELEPVVLTSGDGGSRSRAMPAAELSGRSSLTRSSGHARGQRISICPLVSSRGLDACATSGRISFTYATPVVASTVAT